VNRARFLQPAEEEMVAAMLYYEGQADGLGREFLEKVEFAVRDAAMNPERWPVVQTGVRRRLVSQFPYAVFYRVECEKIVVLAVANLRRRPDYWVSRV
jgi:plasmid stabilization system protein ParE